MNPIKQSPEGGAIHDITVREVTDEAGMQDVLALRERVYVADQARLSSVEDTLETFDKYDRHGTYLVAYVAGVAVGTIKVIRDSEIGLPCESIAKLTVGLDAYRGRGRLVEFGHLVSAPEVRSQGIGMQLMRHALIFSVSRLGATHILGDFFSGKDGQFQPFYAHLGFIPISEPYRDTRFSGSPLSVVGLVEIRGALEVWRKGLESKPKRLDYFLSDYEGYAAKTDDVRKEVQRDHSD